MNSATFGQKKIMQIVLTLFLSICVSSNVYASQPKPVIQSIKVQILSSVPLDSRIIARMENSIVIVAEHILRGKQLTAINNSVYEQLIQDIADRVLTGYTVTKVDLNVDVDTNIVLQINPWGKTIDLIPVNSYLSGIEKLAEPLIQSEVDNMVVEVQKLLQGVSVDAVDWSSGVMREEINKYATKNLPDFKVLTDIVFVDNAYKVELVVVPVGRDIKNVRVHISSDTLPNVLFIDLRERLTTYANQFRAMPLSFISKNKAEIVRNMEKEIAQEYIVEKFDLLTDTNVVLDTDMLINIKVNAKNYRIWAEGYLDIGRKENYASARLHLGKYFSRTDEVFVEPTVSTGDMVWDTSFGYARSIGKTKVSYMYRVPDKVQVLRLEYRFTPRWSMKFEEIHKKNEHQFALRYRFHDFLSVEGVVSNKTNYLRLIGNI